MDAFLTILFALHAPLTIFDVQTWSDSAIILWYAFDFDEFPRLSLFIRHLFCFPLLEALTIIERFWEYSAICQLLWTLTFLWQHIYRTLGGFLLSSFVCSFPCLTSRGTLTFLLIIDSWRLERIHIDAMQLVLLLHELINFSKPIFSSRVCKLIECQLLSCTNTIWWIKLSLRISLLLSNFALWSLLFWSYLFTYRTLILFSYILCLYRGCLCKMYLFWENGLIFMSFISICFCLRIVIMDRFRNWRLLLFTQINV